MRDIALELAGALAILAALLHGVLGETRVFARAQIDPSWVRRLVRAVWHCGVVAWIAAAIGNALATRGRHFGWMVLAAVTVLALVGM